MATLMRRVLNRVRPPDVDATQAWFRLDVSDPERPRRAFDGTFEVRECTVDDLPLLGQLPGDPAVVTPSGRRAERRMRDGGTPWLSIENGKVAFGCWIFTGRAPVFGGRDGGAPLPDDGVLLEDSQAVPTFRGRGVAPATWTAIADRLAERGIRSIYTKVDVENIPSTKAVQKAGFREVGKMRVVRTRGRFTTSVTLDTAADDADRWILALAT